MLIAPDIQLNCRGTIMLVSKREVRSLETYLNRVIKEEREDYKRWTSVPNRDLGALLGITLDLKRDHRFEAYFLRHPHLVLPLGFDEYVGFKRRDQYRHLWFSALKRSEFGSGIFRKPNGQWLLFRAIPGPETPVFEFASKASHDDAEDAEYHSVSDLLSALYRCAEDQNPTSEERIWSPSLWTPAAQEEQRSTLAQTVSTILASIRSERTTLADLSWRVLEDIVAEVLRRSGLDIHVVSDRPQGGRDIVARGQLIPGQEPIQMAVEIKHKAVVDRPDVQSALWQNRMYPALLFVTSGRFTSGVFKEKALPENRLRLFFEGWCCLGRLDSRLHKALRNDGDYS
jgi:hypothetical protein